jgi:hypothetical protein
VYRAQAKIPDSYEPEPLEMTAKHAALLFAAVLALVPLPSPPAESQGILPYLQHSPQDQSQDQPDQTGPTRPASHVPPDGYVPDAETAAKIGEVIMERNYGEIPTMAAKPITATLENGIWIVKRTVLPGYLDGSAEVHISKKDGTILFLSNHM